MLRRTLVITLLVGLTLVCAASPAAALELLWSQEVGQQARLATGSDGPIVAWRSAGVGEHSVQATQYRRTDRAASGPHTLVPPVAGLQDWFVAGDGAGNVTVVWKAGGAVHAKRVDLATGSTLYGPVTVCTDAAVAGARGAGSTAALTGAAGDGAGGVYVWCTVSPSASSGDTLLNHVSSGGSVAVTDPGVAVDKGTVKRRGPRRRAAGLAGPHGSRGPALRRRLCGRLGRPLHPVQPAVPASPGGDAGAHRRHRRGRGDDRVAGGCQRQTPAVLARRRAPVAHAGERQRGRSRQAGGRRQGRSITSRPAARRPPARRAACRTWGSPRRGWTPWRRTAPATSSSPTATCTPPDRRESPA